MVRTTKVCHSHRRVRLQSSWNSFFISFLLARIIQCAVKRRRFSVGAKPTRQLSLQPVAMGGVEEVTNLLKPSV